MHQQWLFHRKLSSQQRDLIVQYAKTENLSSGSVDGVTFEQEDEGQLKDK